MKTKTNIRIWVQYAGIPAILTSVLVFAAAATGADNKYGTENDTMHKNTDKMKDTNGVYYQNETHDKNGMKDTANGVIDTNGRYDTTDGRDTIDGKDTVAGEKAWDEQPYGDAQLNGIDTLSGTIESVEVRDEMLTLALKTQDKGEVRVRTAPESYLQQNGISLSEGDSIQVVGQYVPDGYENGKRDGNGDRMNGQAEPVLEAQKLKVFTNVIELRNQEGSGEWQRRSPWWRGRRRE
jgi:hypothetical protein